MGASRLGIDILGVFDLGEFSLEWEGIRLEPVEKLKVVPSASEGELRRVRVRVDQPWSQEGGAREHDELSVAQLDLARM